MSIKFRKAFLWLGLFVCGGSQGGHAGQEHLLQNGDFYLKKTEGYAVDQVQKFGWGICAGISIFKVIFPKSFRRFSNLIDQSTLRLLTQEEERFLERVGSKILLIQSGCACDYVKHKDLTSGLDFQDFYQKTALAGLLEGEGIDLRNIKIFPSSPMFAKAESAGECNLIEEIEEIKKQKKIIKELIAQIEEGGAGRKERSENLNEKNTDLNEGVVNLDAEKKEAGHLIEEDYSQEYSNLLDEDKIGGPEQEKEEQEKKEKEKENLKILDDIRRSFQEGTPYKIVMLVPLSADDSSVDHLAHLISVSRCSNGNYVVDDPNRAMIWPKTDPIKDLRESLELGHVYKKGHIIVMDLEWDVSLEAQEASWIVEAQKRSDFVQNEIVPFELVTLKNIQDPEKVQGRLYKLDQKRCVVMVGDENPTCYLMPIEKVGLCFEDTKDAFIAELDHEASYTHDQLKKEVSLLSSPYYGINRELFSKGISFSMKKGDISAHLEHYRQMKKGEACEGLVGNNVILSLMSCYFDTESHMLSQVFQRAPADFNTIPNLQKQIAEEIPVFVECERFYEQMVVYLKDKEEEAKGNERKEGDCEKEKGYWDMQHHKLLNCIIKDLEANLYHAQNNSEKDTEEKAEGAIFKTCNSLAVLMTEEQLQRAETKVRKFMD